VIEEDDLERLVAGDHCEPHRILGIHPVAADSWKGVVIRAWHPEATAAWCVYDGRSFAVEQDLIEPVAEVAIPMTRWRESGLFGALVADAGTSLRYRIRFAFADGARVELEDPYRFLPAIGEQDLYYLGEGTHQRLWDVFGAHCRTLDGIAGVAFAVWAPNARSVAVVGDFTHWDGRVLPMRSLGASGVYELFVPGLSAGALYKYEIRTTDGRIRVKADPYARAAERPPGTASRIERSSYAWNDGTYMHEIRDRDPRREPMAIYEVHLGSWRRVPEQDNRPLTYREVAPLLAEHVRSLGFTHVELLPISEFPYDGSWGYQVSGYFAPTSRYGSPDDFRSFVDCMHERGIGVILDWVPAHFPKDDFALRRFDGTALYEHDDPRLAEHPDWGTLIFNYGRKEVRNFLVANALYWLEEFHVDGLRVDAVASMLYRDYSRKEGEWVPNRYGGRENLEAVDFLRHVNQAIRDGYPGRFTVAEESTSWSGVTADVAHGGLGFTFKWNMGWMHDSLTYFSREPVHRRFHQNDLTFAMLYEHSERFLMPLSHDEVVHGKKSLIEKMPGDSWQKFANLRLLLAYQYTRPGKKLLFMGTELAPHGEWTPDASLDWHLAADPQRVGLSRFLADLGRLYRESACLWAWDYDGRGMEWIDVEDHEQSVLSWLRRHERQEMIVVLNLTPVPRESYRIGASRPGRWRLRLSSDDAAYGGSGSPAPAEVVADGAAYHGRPCSFALALPPLAAVVLESID